MTPKWNKPHTKNYPGNMIMISLFRPVVLFVVLFGSACVAAESFPDSFDLHRKDGAIEDVIDIHVTDRELIAVRRGKTITRERLDLHEEVLWIGTRGHVGAVLTDRRFLAVSATIPGWRQERLRIEEVSKDPERELMISDFLVMAVMPKRVIVFDGLANDWAKMDIPLHDPVQRAVLENFVGVVITEKRLFGVAARRGRFVENNFQINESIISVTSRPHSISIRTNRRLLVFRSRSPFWDSLNLR